MSGYIGYIKSAAEEGKKVFVMEWGLKSGGSVMLLDDGGMGRLGMALFMGKSGKLGIRRLV